MSEGESVGTGLFAPYTLNYNGTDEASDVSACIVAREFPSGPGRKLLTGWGHRIICIFPMSKATKQVVGTDTKLEAFFKDENDDPVLRKPLLLTTTLGEVRKANPFGPGELWIDFHLAGAGRLERIELFSTRNQRGARLSYHMDLDDIIPQSGDNESLERLISTVEVVIWEWGERIKSALGADSFAVNWGGPNAKYVPADGSAMYYLDGRMAYLVFEREHKSRKELDSVTLNELSTRASVLCDFVEKMSDEIRNYHPEIAFPKRKPTE